MNNTSVYIIAEAGVNHNGNKDMALRLVDAAAETGADAVKFQTFNAKKLASPKVDKALYQKQTTGDAQTQRDILEALELPESWHHELQAHAHHRGIEFLSTAFDTGSLNFLNSLDIPLFKIPSGELTNAPLVWKFARTGKPLIISTGMATLSEVEQALAIVTHALNAPEQPKNIAEVWSYWADAKARDKLSNHITLLHCTSQYPTPWNDVNLKAMDTLAAAFHLPVGYSDHTEGTVISVAAVARGARVIEKHFTLDRTLPGPDHKASLEVDAFQKMVQEIRAIEAALGHGIKAPQLCEWDTRNVARQSIIAAKPLAIGQIISEDDLTTARTGGGLDPVHWWQLIGTKTQKSYQEGDALFY